MKFFMLQGLDRRHTAAQMKTLLLALEAANITLIGGYVAQSQARCNYTMPQINAMHTFMTAIGAAEVTHLLLDLGDPKDPDEKYRARVAGVKRHSRHECGLVAAVLHAMATAGAVHLPGVPPASGLYGSASNSSTGPGATPETGQLLSLPSSPPCLPVCLSVCLSV